MGKTIKVIDLEGNQSNFNGTKKQFLKNQQDTFYWVEIGLLVDPDTKEITAYDKEEMRCLVADAEAEFA